MDEVEMVVVQCGYRWGRGCRRRTPISVHTCGNEVIVLKSDKRNYKKRTAYCSGHVCVACKSPEKAQV
jgi:hypothetical protein